jgi:hypothetical protein
VCCPKCGLENPPNATLCDCGYAFVVSSTGTKKCPSCAETILADARKCRFCGEFLNPADAPVRAGKPSVRPHMPVTVKAAVCLLVISEVLGTIAMTLPEFKATFKAALNAASAFGLPTNFGVAIGLIGFGFLTFSAIMFVLRQNWARIAFIVIGLLNAPFSVIGVLLAPNWGRLIQTALSLGVLCLVIMPSSTEWFKGSRHSTTRVSNKIRFTIGLLVLPFIAEMVVLELQSRSALNESGNPEGSKVGAEDAKPRVTYKVTGTVHGASLAYLNSSGGTEQQTVNLPWQLAFDAPVGTIVYLSAQKEAEWGNVKAEIYEETELLQSAESTSPYGLATVGGEVRSTGFSGMLPVQHLEQAKLALKLGLEREAAHHLDSIPKSAPEAAEAAELGELTVQQVREWANEVMRSAILQQGEKLLKKREQDATATAVGQQMILSADYLGDVSLQKEMLTTFRKSGLASAFCKAGFREIRFTGRGMVALDHVVLPSGGRTYSLGCQ